MLSARVVEGFGEGRRSERELWSEKEEEESWRVYGGRFEDAVAGGECGVKRGELSGPS